MRPYKVRIISSIFCVLTGMAITLSPVSNAQAQATASLSVSKTNAYELNPLNEGRFTVTLSAASVGDTTVNYSVGGTAVNGTDYTNIPGSIVISNGQTSAIVRIRPINNNIVDGDRSVILTLTSGTGYVLGTAITGTVFIKDDDLQPAPLVYFENFDTDDSANWAVNVTSGGSNSANIFFDYSTVGIPSAPNSTNGTTRGLRLQANIFGGNPSASFPVGVSASPIGLTLTNTSYRLRFDMWCNYNGPLPAGGSGSTHLTGAGVGTAGTSVQVAGSALDSVDFDSSGDGGTSSDYRAYSPDAPSSYQDTALDVYTASTVNTNAVRNSSNPYYSDFGGEAAPAAQLSAYPNQTGVTSVGAGGFQWRDVLLVKVGDSYSYSIDGKLIETVSGPFTAALGGANILFQQFDINGGASADTNSVALQFGLIDNVRVEAITVPVVSVTASTAVAMEQGPVNGQYTFTRVGDTTGTLKVNYTMTGTASNGVDYVTLPGSVTFQPGMDTTNIALVPIDDTLSEFTETAILKISPNSAYAPSAPTTATIAIVDNDPVRADVTVVQSSMYEHTTNDYITFQIERRGDTNAPAFTVNVSYSGTAASGVDFTPTPSVFVDQGVVFQTFTVSPIDDNLLEGNETVIVTVTSGTGYIVGTNSPSATGTIIDDEMPAAPVLFADSLSNSSTSNNWQIRFMANNLIDDYEADFGYDLTADGIPTAPNGSNNALKVTVNKFEGSANGAAGLNVYPIGQSFSGSYAVRFNMFHREGGNESLATEYALFGINHSGLKTNRFSSSAGGTQPTDADGLFFGVNADGSGSSPGDFVLFRGDGATNAPFQLSSLGAAAFRNIFKNPPYTPNDPSTPGQEVGVPSNGSLSSTPTWADVEIRQIGNRVNMLINNSPVIQITNTSAYTNGDIMLGYCDSYDSVGGTEAATYFSNVRVVALNMQINQTQLSGTNVVMNFTWPLDEATSLFKVQRATAVTGPYADVSNGTITRVSPGVYTATAGQSGANAFYRIRR